MAARKGSAIVLDLDETLLYSTARAVDGRRPDYCYGDLVGYFRPGALDFLRYCRARFAYVIVFTAGAPPYAKAMVAALERASGVRFDFTFDRRACTEETDNTAFLEYWNRYVKHLSALRERLLPADVAERIDWDDTLLLDDFAHNARENLHQAMLMPKFSRHSASSPHNGRSGNCDNRNDGDDDDDDNDDDEWLARAQRFIDAKPLGVKWVHVDRTFWFLL